MQITSLHPKMSVAQSTSITRTHQVSQATADKVVSSVRFGFHASPDLVKAYDRIQRPIMSYLPYTVEFGPYFPPIPFLNSRKEIRKHIEITVLDVAHNAILRPLDNFVRSLASQGVSGENIEVIVSDGKQFTPRFTKHILFNLGLSTDTPPKIRTADEPAATEAQYPQRIKQFLELLRVELTASIKKITQQDKFRTFDLSERNGQIIAHNIKPNKNQVTPTDD